MVNELNKTNSQLKLENSTNDVEASFVSALLLNNPNFGNQMDFQQQQQQLLSTLFMYPSLFITPPTLVAPTANATHASTSSPQFNIDQLIQQQLVSQQQQQQPNFLNNEILATLTSGFLQQQQRQQAVDMSLSNNIWSKLLTDMSSSLASNLNSPVLVQQQQTSNLKLGSNVDVSSKSHKINQEQQPLKNSNKLANSKLQSEDHINFKNGKATISNGKSQSNVHANSSFAIKDLIKNKNLVNNNSNRNSAHLGHSQNNSKSSTSEEFSQKYQHTSTINKLSKQTKQASKIGNSTSNLEDLKNRNDALLMYAALLQNSANDTNNQIANQSNQFNLLENMNSLECLLQLAKQNPQLLYNPQQNNQKSNKPKHQQSANSKIDFNTNADSLYQKDSLSLKISKLQQNKTSDIMNKNAKINSNDAIKHLPAIKSKNNSVTNPEEQNIEAIEAKIRIPLRYGWRRETIIKEVHKNGVKGDVIYLSPCGKKLRTFQEIERYLTKNAKDLEEKGISLCKDNFTYSSKLIVGNFLQFKQLNYEDLNEINKIDETNETKFNILNEEDVINLITSVNPKFRTHRQLMNESPTSIQIDCPIKRVESCSPESPQINPPLEQSDHDIELKLKIESLKQLKQEQENLSRNQQAQMIEQQRIEQERLEQNLKLKLNDLKIDLKQDRLNQQQEKQNRIIEAKRREKYLQRERKTREKWFEHILMREQQSRQQTIQIVDGMNGKSQLVFDSIDDMQEKYLKKMPEFTQLHSDDPEKIEEESNKLSLIGDCLQVIEFVDKFGPKLSESLVNKQQKASADTQSEDSLQFSGILNNLESFLCGLENRNEKLKRELAQLVQLLLKCAINTIEDRSLNFNESTGLNKPNDEECSDDLKRHLIDAQLYQEDDFYYVKRLKQLECNDTTYSELLRLYVKRSFYHLQQRRQHTANKYKIDVTFDLFENLKRYLSNLELKTFEQLDTSIKANLLAWLCDELLSTSGQSEELTYQDDYRSPSCVVEDLDQTIEQLNDLKHDKWLLESKFRQTKTEKLTASVNLNKLSKKLESHESENNSTDSDIKEKEKTQKLLQQIDKRLVQFDKKRVQAKLSYDKCLNKLRSGIHLGQDRYLRHYWSLDHSGGIIVEAASKVSIGSIYLSESSADLSPDVVKKAEDDMLNEDQEETLTLQTYSHLVERLSEEDPFKFVLKFNNDNVINLTFRQIEYLVRNEIQQKRPNKIDKKYLNRSSNESAKWWLCNNEVIFKQLIDCLSKRGYREKLLAKCLSKLNEENFTNSNSSVSITDSIINSENNETTTSANPSLFNRISNNLGNLRMFEKMTFFFKDFVANDQSQSRTLNQIKQQDYKDRAKALKLFYTLEDRVFKANLQQPGNKEDENNSDNSECPLEIAKNRLLELEIRIERRYLKYPFVPRRKITNMKLSTQVDSEDKNDEEEPLEIKPKQATLELERWRRLVKNCKTTSQLAILISELNKLIEWEKSIMKVICQICNCDDNEDKLLLCDNCDKGNHTYCFKPVMNQIPEGDWYCFVCIGKLKNENLCCVCGSSEPSCPYTADDVYESDLNKCEKCLKSFHGQCMPYARYFKTSHKWHCLNCQNIKPPVSPLETSLAEAKRNLSTIQNLNKVAFNKKRRKQEQSNETLPTQPLSKKIKTSDVEQSLSKAAKNCKKLNKKSSELNATIDDETNNDENNENKCFKYNDSDDSLKKQLKKKTVIVKKARMTKKESKIDTKAIKKVKLNESKSSNLNRDKDLVICANLLNDLTKNENSWPFADKVDPKLYPDYYEIIKDPMDIQTIRNKIKNKQYETKEDFAFDCRLIFDNCEYFNEDDSPIGKAGHKLRAFFETKWLKLFD